MRKLFLSIIALTLSVGMWAETETDVPYVDKYGIPTTCTSATVITSGTHTLSAGWYVVTATQVTTGPLTCTGDVHLILADNSVLTVQGGGHQAGITVSGEGNSLTIYGQANQRGQLRATGGSYSSGIGGGYQGSGSNITIYGGQVTATGGPNGSGIGGGDQGSGSNITITGGQVTATGGDRGAGIGGGSQGSGSNITITGGQVTAIGGNYGSGIGGGDQGSGSNITITGGQVTAIGGNSGSGIGGGYDGSGSSIRVGANCQVLAGKNEASTSKIKHISSDDIATALSMCQYVATHEIAPPKLQSVSYIDAIGQQQTVAATEITNETNVLSAGWYVVTGDNVSPELLICKDDVNIILADGAKLTTQGGPHYPGILVQEKTSLTIYGQANQTGKLIATGGQGEAGIGGGVRTPGTSITINGGTITATGGDNGAGIGGGVGTDEIKITINGGTITATGGDNGAGIGGGNTTYITINGGTITATGGNNGAGIGGGNTAVSSAYITINGGTITATGGDNGAGIGRRNQGDNLIIRVSADYKVLAGENESLTSEIEHDSDTNLASALSSKPYAFIEINPTILSVLQDEAIAVIDSAIEGVTNADILGIAQEAKNKIMNADNRTAINTIKDAALAKLEELVRIYKSGKADAFGPLGEEHPGPAVKVTKDDTEVILYLPDKVEYIIRK